MSTWFEAEATWPVHDKSHWRKPMAQAQAAGWILEYIGAPHLFGYAHCPKKQHKFKIDKTASGAGFWATEASKIITRNCRHGPTSEAGKVQARRDEATAGLDAVSAIYDSVEADLVVLETIGQGWERALRLERSRDRLLLRMETANLTLSDLDDAAALPGGTEDDVAALDAELEAELEAVGHLEPGPQLEKVRSRLDEADAVILEVQGVGGKLSRRPALADSVHAGIAAAHSRHADLLARMGVLERLAPPDG